jgi:hypothetical protein
MRVHLMWHIFGEWPGGSFPRARRAARKARSVRNSPAVETLDDRVLLNVAGAAGSLMPAHQVADHQKHHGTGSHGHSQHMKHAKGMGSGGSLPAPYVGGGGGGSLPAPYMGGGGSLPAPYMGGGGSLPAPYMGGGY